MTTGPHVTAGVGLHMTSDHDEKCPLCGRQCAAQKDAGTTTFRCPHCFEFSMSDEALAKLTTLTFSYRNALMLDVLQAHLLEKLLQITLSPEGAALPFRRVIV